MSDTHEEIREAIKNSISTLFNKTLKNNREEMALIALNGGCELTIRDRLIYALQEELSGNYIVKSEYTSEEHSLRADMAILEPVPGSVDKVIALIEMKNNFSCDLTPITGAPYTQWTKKGVDVKKIKHAHTRIFEDFLKWNETEYEGILFGVNIVSCFEEIPLSENFGQLKYEKINEVDKNHECYGFYKLYLKRLNLGLITEKHNNKNIKSLIEFKTICDNVTYEFNYSKEYNVKGVINIAIHEGECGE